MVRSVRLWDFRTLKPDTQHSSVHYTHEIEIEEEPWWHDSAQKNSKQRVHSRIIPPTHVPSQSLWSAWQPSSLSWLTELGANSADPRDGSWFWPDGWTKAALSGIVLVVKVHGLWSTACLAKCSNHAGGLYLHRNRVDVSCLVLSRYLSVLFLCHYLIHEKNANWAGPAISASSHLISIFYHKFR